MADTPTIWLADDEKAARTFLEQAATVPDARIEVFEDGPSLLAALPEIPAPGMVLTDICMPGMDGIELTTSATQKAPWLPVVLISGQGDLPTAVRAMHAGAVGFLEKPCSIDQVHEEIARTLVEAHRRHDVWHSHFDAVERIARLTKREREVAEKLCEGMSNKQVAIALKLSPRTVEIHRSHIMMRTHAESFAELIRLWMLAHNKPESQPKA